MMARHPGVARCDDKGRLPLAKELRERYGEEFLIMQRRDSVVLIPTSKDPLKELARIGRGIPEKDLRKVKSEIRALAGDLAARKWRE